MTEKAAALLPSQKFRSPVNDHKEGKMKRRIAATAGFLAIALASQSSYAKTLEDVLKEKGVITEEDYKEITRVKAQDYKLGKGFTFTTNDEKFQLTIGGRMQFRYTFQDFDNDSTSSDYSQWNAQRIRLIAQGYALSKDFSYKMEIDPRVLAESKDNKSRGGLLDCYVNYKVADELQFLVGQTKVKYGYSMIQSDGNLMFVDRVPWIGKMTPSYEIGAFGYGQAFNGLVDYAMSVTNGDGQTYSGDTNHNAFAARVAVSPLGTMSNDEPDLAISEKPLFTIGANYLYNSLNAGENWGSYGTQWNGYRDINNYGFDVHFKWMGLAVQGEVLFAQGENRATEIDNRTMGWYGQVGYNITPKLGIAFRYSQFDKDRDTSDDLESEQVGAISYYLAKHYVKVQADIGNVHTQRPTGPTTDDMRYRAQLQMMF
jgi:phosphate-selective porin OprO/OprP